MFACAPQPGANAGAPSISLAQRRLAVYLTARRRWRRCRDSRSVNRHASARAFGRAALARSRRARSLARAAHGGGAPHENDEPQSRSEDEADYSRCAPAGSASHQRAPMALERWWWAHTRTTATRWAHHSQTLPSLSKSSTQSFASSRSAQSVVYLPAAATQMARTHLRPGVAATLAESSRERRHAVYIRRDLTATAVTRRRPPQLENGTTRRT